MLTETFTVSKAWGQSVTACLALMRITPNGVLAQNFVLLKWAIDFVGVAHTHKGMIPLTLIPYTQ